MKPNDLLIVCECLNTPGSQALTQVYLSALCAVLGQQPDPANFCDTFRRISLLDSNGLHIFSHLYMADMNVLFQMIFLFTLLRRNEVALKRLCLKHQRDRCEGFFLDTNRVLNFFELNGQRPDVPQVFPVLLGQGPLLPLFF